MHQRLDLGFTDTAGALRPRQHQGQFLRREGETLVELGVDGDGGRRLLGVSQGDRRAFAGDEVLGALDANRVADLPAFLFGSELSFVLARDEVAQHQRILELILRLSRNDVLDLDIVGHWLVP